MENEKKLEGTIGVPDVPNVHASGFQGRATALLVVTRVGDVTAEEHNRVVEELRGMGMRVVGVRCNPCSNFPPVSVVHLWA